MDARTRSKLDDWKGLGRRNRRQAGVRPGPTGRSPRMILRAAVKVGPVPPAHGRRPLDLDGCGQAVEHNGKFGLGRSIPDPTPWLRLLSSLVDTTPTGELV